MKVENMKKMKVKEVKIDKGGEGKVEMKMKIKDMKI